ncbi:Calmodulin-binding protein 60 B [Sesamum alatum]|uniref:Calmodulin-binding protein 60 B n=1 Tax=Sesamum alatum TaxID=300844 RepID=A0AAE1YV88_9LAMI|nr:Calmodulin-binding protein 60 B [Sesamum alatum]
MEVNMQMEGVNNGGSEQASSSDDGQFVVALREMMKKEIEVTVIRTVERVIVPILGDLIRKVVKEEIQSAQEKFLIGGKRSHAKEMATSNERSLHLKFFDEVSGPVLTGKAIEGKGGTPMRVALVDKITGQVVDGGPESSAKVEIVVLEAGDNDNEQDLSLEDFNHRIIREGDKTKPHFPKSNYIYLKEGVGVLCNVKLGHDSSWMKSCNCRLGARIVENFGGIKVQAAWTESFMVSDSRSKLYGKHYPPSLSDPVWRLDNIGKDGARCQRLNKNNVLTVRDFRFLHTIDPERLQNIVGAGAEILKATLDHARTCNIDDKRIYLYYPSSELKMGVAFDVVGGLKGVIHDSHYVPNNHLSETEKDCAHNLLLSAFENRNEITSFSDETALLHQFQDRSSYVSAATSSSIEDGLHDRHLTISQSTNGYDPTEPGTSSQSISPSIRPYGHPNTNHHFGSLGSTTTGQLHDPFLGVPNQSPSSPFSDLNHLLENFGDNECLMSLIFPERNNSSESLRAESHSRQQSNAGSIHLFRAVAVMLWMFRARKRVMALGGVHVQKRRRI